MIKLSTATPVPPGETATLRAECPLGFRLKQLRYSAEVETDLRNVDIKDVIQGLVLGLRAKEDGVVTAMFTPGTGYAGLTVRDDVPPLSLEITVKNPDSIPHVFSFDALDETEVPPPTPERRRPQACIYCRTVHDHGSDFDGACEKCAHIVDTYPELTRWVLARIQDAVEDHQNLYAHNITEEDR